MKAKRYATGGQLTKAINKSFYPTNYSVPMLGFGDFLKDAGMLWGDFMLSQFGGGDLIKDDMYNSNFFKKASKVAEPIGQIGGQIAGNIIAPGVGGQVMGSVQQGVSSVVPTDIPSNESDMIEQQKKLMLQQQYGFAMGGKFKPSGRGNLFQPRKDGELVHPLKEWKESRKNKVDFGGGKFGGAGAGVQSGNGRKQIRWTDLRTPVEGDSFNDAFRQARQSGLPQFDYMGKIYNTELAPDSLYDRNAGRHRPTVRLRTVFDENNQLVQDSTRIEPELGQPIVLPIDKGYIDTWADGGMLPSYSKGNFTQPNNVTVYAEGGFHETNPNGGIPLGNKALVEQGEVRYNSKKYGDYIFSDRF